MNRSIQPHQYDKTRKIQKWKDNADLDFRRTIEKQKTLSPLSSISSSSHRSYQDIYSISCKSARQTPLIYLFKTMRQYIMLFFRREKFPKSKSTSSEIPKKNFGFKFSQKQEGAYGLNSTRCDLWRCNSLKPQHFTHRNF